MSNYTIARALTSEMFKRHSDLVKSNQRSRLDFDDDGIDYDTQSRFAAQAILDLYDHIVANDMTDTAEEITVNQMIDMVRNSFDELVRQGWLPYSNVSSAVCDYLGVPYAE